MNLTKSVHEEGLRIAAETGEETRRVFLRHIVGNVVGTSIALLPGAVLSARYGIVRGLLGGAAVSGALAAGLWLLAEKTGFRLPTIPSSTDAATSPAKGTSA